MRGTHTFVGLVFTILILGFAAEANAVRPTEGDGCEERCGQGGRKSLFCHIPQGNPNNPQEICIDDSSVPSHLEEHAGDHCGACEITCEEIVCCSEEESSEIPSLNILVQDSDGRDGDLCCEPDTDGDGECGTKDQCPEDPDKTEPGVCGCEVSDADTDGDGTPDCDDDCAEDPGKTNPGVCGCGVADDDSDGDGIPDCNDVCPEQPNVDSDSDEALDCLEACPDDPAKTEAGLCGCGVADDDTDGDGAPDCDDNCVNDPDKTNPGICGCGLSDVDGDGNGIADCNDDDSELAGEPDAPGDGNGEGGGGKGAGISYGGGLCGLVKGDQESSAPWYFLAMAAVTTLLGAIRRKSAVRASR
jgi:hypothetical protein